MMDVALFAKLLEAVKKGATLILLGDKDQLASVEAGSLFGGLCQAGNSRNCFSPERLAFINSFIGQEDKAIPDTAIRERDQHPLFEHIIELHKSHRFSSEKGIGRFSKAVIENNTAIIGQFLVPGYDAQVKVDQAYSAALLEDFVTGYGEQNTTRDTLLHFTCGIKIAR